jgi:bifunctional DNA-binding transcriptional regulator/antitoxin component of YhaV-PrlF toxin-antitoxin module
MPAFEEVRTVTADGRLVVPWVVQRALGLEHGGPVRFRVDNGVVTLIGADARKTDAVAPADGGIPRRTGVRQELAAELNTLLAVGVRERQGQ